MTGPAKINGLVLENGLNHEIIKDLVMMLVSGKHNYHYEGGYIPRKAINVFAQPRKTLENVHELSLDEHQKGQLNPLTVAPFDRQNCEEYIRTANKLWKTHDVIEQAKVYTIGKENFYETLIAGHRRFGGWNHTELEEFQNCPQCQEMWIVGCDSCQKIWKNRHRKMPQGFCYKRHFGTVPGKPRELLEVRFCVGITPVEALFLQLSENTHMAVPAHEEAQAYAQLFKLVREVDEKFSYSSFGKLVGRNPDTVRNAIRYMELPRSIQAEVEKKTIPYGIALEIARLQVMGFKKEALDEWVIRAVVNAYNVEDFRKIVTEFITNYNLGQESLFNIFSEEQRKELEKPHFRWVVERHSIMAIWKFIEYFSKVLGLFEENRLGKTDSPFSHRSPLNVFRKIIDLLEKLLPHMWSLLPKKERGRSKAVLGETKLVVSKLEQHAQD